MKKNIAIVMGIAFALFVGCFAWTNMTATKVEKTTVNSMVVDTVDAGTDLVTDALDEVKINYVYDEMVNDPETMDWYRDGYPEARFAIKRTANNFKHKVKKVINR